MKRLSVLLIPLIVTVPLLGACEGDRQMGQKQTIGTIAGAVLGGYLGSKIGSGEGRLWATGGGAVLGAILGSEIGKTLDEHDRLKMERTTQAALEHTRSGTVSSWQNPDSGNSGTVMPVRTFQQADGANCRDFEQTIVVGGETRQATGTACRQADGSWRIVN